MAEIGSIIEVDVTRVEPYGVYFRHDADEGLVLAPDFSWRPAIDLKALVHKGDRLKVFVLRHNEQTGQIAGSVRLLQPEENPFKALERFSPGEKLQGTVTFASGGDEVIVKLANGAWGVLGKKSMNRELGNGETIRVEIETLDADEGRLTFTLAHEASPGSNHPVLTAGLAPPVQSSR